MRPLRLPPHWSSGGESLPSVPRRSAGFGQAPVTTTPATTTGVPLGGRGSQLELIFGLLTAAGLLVLPGGWKILAALPALGFVTTVEFSKWQG